MVRKDGEMAGGDRARRRPRPPIGFRPAPEPEPGLNLGEICVAVAVRLGLPIEEVIRHNGPLLLDLYEESERQAARQHLAAVEAACVPHTKEPGNVIEKIRESAMK